MMRTRLLKRAFAGLACAAMVSTVAACGSTSSSSSESGTSPGSQAKPVLNMGVFPALRPLELVRATKTLEKMGYTVHWHDFLQGAPAEAAALASGSIDFAEADSSGLLQIAAKSPGLFWYIGNGATNYVAVVATKGQGVSSIKDLSGKKVGGVNPNTTPTAVLQLAMAKVGLKLSDITGINMTGPSEPGAAQKGAVAAFTTYVPYSAQMLRTGEATLLATASDVYGSTWLGGGIAVLPSFAKEHKQAVVDVMKAVIQAETLMRNDPKTADSDLAKVTGTSLADVTYAYAHDLVGTVSTVVPDKAAIIKQSEVLAKYGVIKVPDVSSFVNDLVHPEYATLAGK